MSIFIFKSENKHNSSGCIKHKNNMNVIRMVVNSFKEPIQKLTHDIKLSVKNG
jgi:hypothetical protein